MEREDEWKLGERFQLRPRDQATVAVLSLLLAGGWMIGWVSRGAWRGEWVRWETPADRDTPIRFLVDVNQAEWAELAALPRIGETLAKRIIASRERHGPFRSPEELQRVRGIGPRTVELLRQYVIAGPDAAADRVKANVEAGDPSENPAATLDLSSADAPAGVRRSHHRESSDAVRLASAL